LTLILAELARIANLLHAFNPSEDIWPLRLPGSKLRRYGAIPVLRYMADIIDISTQ